MPSTKASAAGDISCHLGLSMVLDPELLYVYTYTLLPLLLITSVLSIKVLFQASSNQCM